MKKLFLGLLFVAGVLQAAVKPNVIIILTDDQGYGDLGCFGGDHVKTPRIDRMAAEGAKLTSFYVGGAVCTPSRAALMTGCYPKRIDMAVGSVHGVILAADAKGLHPNEITIAEVMKAEGYRTGMFGKWHLGDQREFLPTRQGFDEFYGIPYSHDIYPNHPGQKKMQFPPLPLLEGETVVELNPDADYLTKHMTERSLSFIEKNKNVPFFLYLAHPLPHRPIHLSPPFMKEVPDSIKAKLASEKENNTTNFGVRDKIYPLAINEIDGSVGQILDALKEHGIDDNTLVIFTSDNGPWTGSAKPLRGKKAQTYEGGQRVPAVVRWPGHIPAGQVNDEIMTTMDLFPTMARLIGAKIPSDRKIDGLDIWPVLTKGATSPHKAFFYYKKNELQAVRSGSWKLHQKKGRPTELYNLDEDISESTNILKAHPEVAQKLLAAIIEFEAELAQNNRPAGMVENPKPLSK